MRGCQRSCSDGSYKVGAYCVKCPLNTVFDDKLLVCACKAGWVKNINQICEPNQIAPITCDSGKFYDPQEGCLSCSGDCKTCTGSAFYCLSCQSALLALVQGKCVSLCGNGLLDSSEKCDDKNNINGDGCSQCQVDSGYTCTSSPSVCTPIANNNCGNGVVQSGEGCDDKNKVGGDGCSANCQVESGFSCSGNPSVCKAKPIGMSIVGDPIINTGAVYGIIRTDKQFIFESQEEMMNFMQYRFQEGTEPANAYCNQKPEDPALFNCFFIYPSGVPLFEFSIGLSFNFKGDTGRLDFPVDYKKSAFAMRSLYG